MTTHDASADRARPDVSPRTDADARADVDRQIAGDPTIGYLGIEFTEVTPERVSVRMPVVDGMRNAFGIVQGGFTFVLADCAFAFVATASGTPMVTHHANATYLAPARGEHIEATAVIRHRYGRHAIIDVEVRDADGTAVSALTMHGVRAPKAPDGA